MKGMDFSRAKVDLRGCAGREDPLIGEERKERKNVMFDTLQQNLEKRGYTVTCFSSKEEAAAHINEEVDGKTVGFGGSVTISQMDLYHSLGTHNEVTWHDFAADPEERKAMQKKSMTTDVYISSVNGLAETGEIVNIDGTSNRVSSTLFGHEKVIFVVGRNKIAATCNDALDRARNIAAPKNAQRLGRNTPCARRADHCYDCDSPDRICCSLVVSWRKPMGADVEIVLIDEDLGF